MLRALAALAIAVLMMSPASAQGWGSNAERLEARIGAGFYDSGPLTNWGLRDFAFNAELLAPSPGFLAGIGAPRPFLGVDISTASAPIHFVYGGLSWDYHFTNRFYASGNLGGAVNTASQLVASSNTRSLGTRATFHVGAALGYDFTPNLTGQLYWNHFSNGYLVSPNEGHDSIGLRFGARF